jgi:hypothetical protein
MESALRAHWTASPTAGTGSAGLIAAPAQGARAAWAGAWQVAAA